jgi:hypothetical protein
LGYVAQVLKGRGDRTAEGVLARSPRAMVDALRNCHRSIFYMGNPFVVCATNGARVLLEPHPILVGSIESEELREIAAADIRSRERFRFLVEDADGFLRPFEKLMAII